MANSTFMAECFWPDLDPGQVQRAADRLAQCARQSSNDGVSIRFAGSIVVTGDDVIFFLFEAVTAEQVSKVCQSAGLHFERVVGSVVSACH